MAPKTSQHGHGTETRAQGDSLPTDSAEEAFFLLGTDIAGDDGAGFGFLACAGHDRPAIAKN